MSRVLRLVRWFVIAVAVTALPVAAGVLVLDDDDQQPTEEARPEPPAYASTALEDYDTSTVALSRAPFCDRLSDEAVAEALNGTADTDSTAEAVTYANGESAEIAPGLEDVAHEYGCRIEGRRGAEVRAWLFAPPVTEERASDLIDEASGRGSCTQPATAPSYGAPSLALVCPAGDRLWASFRGLFGDAWLACSLSVPAAVGEDELLARAGRWCVAVAQAASSDASAAQQ